MGFITFKCMDCGGLLKLPRPHEDDPDLTVDSLCDDCDPEYGLDSSDEWDEESTGN
jgi:hypothetical protein